MNIRIRNNKTRTKMVPFGVYFGHQMYAAQKDMNTIYSDPFINCDIYVVTASGFAICVARAQTLQAKKHSVSQAQFDDWLIRTEKDQIVKGAIK